MAIYTSFTISKNHVLYMLVLEFLLVYIVLRLKTDTNILILDIEDQNTNYVFASKGNHTAYLNLRLSQHQSV
jgi:hypothetical protein